MQHPILKAGLLAASAPPPPPPPRPEEKPNEPPHKPDDRSDVGEEDPGAAIEEMVDPPEQD